MAAALVLATFASACGTVAETTAIESSTPTVAVEDTPPEPSSSAALSATPRSAPEHMPRLVANCDDLEPLDVADYPAESPAELVNDVFSNRLFPSGLGDGGSGPGRFGVWELELYSLDDTSLAMAADLFADLDVCVHGPDPVTDAVDEREHFTILTSGQPTMTELTGAAVEVIQDAARLADVADKLTLQGSVPVVDFERNYIVALDGPVWRCAWMLTSLDTVDGLAVPTFGNPGYHSCDDHDRPEGTLILQLERPTEASTVSFADRHGRPAVTADVGSRTTSGEVRPPQRTVTDPVGIVEAPAPGVTYATTLDDGTPVFVVGHLDGRVSVVDARRRDPEGALLRNWVSWATEARRFIGIGWDRSGAWDEYGRDLVEGMYADLSVYASVTDGASVIVGADLAREPGHPITGELTGEGGRRIRPVWPTVVDYDAVPDVPAGTVVTVDAALIEVTDGSYRLCPASATGFGPLPTCGANAPVVVDLTDEGADGRCRSTEGRLVLRTTPDGVAEVGVTAFVFGGSSAEC